MQRLFKEYDLEITAESKQKIFNYLDVMSNLKDSTFGLYHESNDQIQYTHRESNHPPNIIKHIPATIENHLSELSSKHYADNLHQSGRNKNLTYKPTDTKYENHSKHKKKIIWFNPPLSRNVSTNCKIFFMPVALTFPKEPHL